MMELGEERVQRWTKNNGGKRVEEMSCDSIKTHQTLSTLCTSLSVGGSDRVC